MSENLEILKALINAGCNVEVRDSNGRLPLEVKYLLILILDIIILLVVCVHWEQGNNSIATAAIKC